MGGADFAQTNPMINGGERGDSKEYVKVEEKTAVKPTGGGGWFWNNSTEEAEEDSSSDEEDYSDDEEEPLVGSGKTKKEKEAEEDEEEEMREQVNSFKNMTGVWDIDPADSEWLKFSKKDHNTDTITPMGSVCVSLQIWPKDKAIAMPSGGGRNEPNNNPFLPPPVGRLQVCIRAI